MEILRIKISDTDNIKALETAKRFLFDGRKHLITTPNPEIILASQNDIELFHILNKSDLSLPDGIGLKFAALMIGKKISRIAGSDFLPKLLALAESERKRVGIFIWDGGLSNKEDVSNAIKKIFPKLDFLVEEVSRVNNLTPNSNWKEFSPEIIFIGLGSPWQEKLAYCLLHAISSVKISMVVGGSFDFICGKQNRAPKFFRAIGFEWLWRLIKQPSRWRRIYNAVIIFPIVVFRNIFIRPFFYRKNVVALIYNDRKEILIVNWAQDGDYWGIPQGGVDDGETDEQAIKREMIEEIGSNNFEIIGYYKNIFKYRWPPNYSRFGYKGQKQSLFILKYLGKNDDIKLSPLEHIDYKWVDVNNLIKESHPVHEKGYTIFLEKFKELK